MEYVLGIDVGSSSTKVGLFSLDGDAVYMASRSHASREPLPNYKEQDPEAWWEASVDCIREVSQNVPRDAIVGIGAVGHISSMTFVDSTGTPIRPAVEFQDMRATAEVEEVRRLYPRQELARQLGIDLPPAPTWPLPRLLWFQKHEPRTIERARALLQAKDFVNLRLTGEFSSDLSSNRGLVNLATGCVPREVFKRFGLPEGLLPQLINASSVMGRVTAAAARETGLREGLPVASGWNDLNGCVIGSGGVDPGCGFNITGTSEHVGVITAEGHDAPELICAPYLDGRKLFYGVTSSGGGSLEWYRNTFRRTISDLIFRAERVPPGCNGLVFLPYLQGERSPIWDPFAAGAFIGIKAGHNEGHFVRAILEGVAFSLRQILEVVEQRAKKNLATLAVTGGGASSPLWNRIKADVLGRAIVVPQQVQAGVLGAAILAAVATGRYPSCDLAARAMVRLCEAVQPDPKISPAYDAPYARFCELYPALKDWFSRVHEGRQEAVHTYE